MTSKPTLRDLERAAVRACRSSCQLRDRAYGSNTGEGSAYDWRADVQVIIYVCEIPAERGLWPRARWTMRHYRRVEAKGPSRLTRSEARTLIEQAGGVAA